MTSFQRSGKKPTWIRWLQHISASVSPACRCWDVPHVAYNHITRVPCYRHMALPVLASVFLGPTVPIPDSTYVSSLAD